MREHVKDRATIIMTLVLLALVAVEFLVPHDHPRFPWHHVPGYAAMIGLFSCLIIVQLSKSLGKWLLQRPERDDD
jgi:Na+/H+ antiporter NhaD/arsenite permease-like protein